MTQLNRRDFGRTCLAAAALGVAPAAATRAEDPSAFRLNYIVASCLYGTAPLAEILPEVRKTGAEFIELWARPHGSQREQLDELGVEACAALLQQHQVRLGSCTCFKVGLFGMQPEMRLVKQLGGDLVICNTGGPKDLTGDTLQSEIQKLAEKLKPEIEAAEELGVTIGIENHGSSLVNLPEAQYRLLDALPSPRLGIALAPYHLPQDPELLASLIQRLGDRLVHFQAWQHGLGCMTKLPKEQELLQLPGRGDLDFTPLLAALKKIRYRGRTEIFMHPFPRGIPILDTTAAVTAELNRAREHLEKCLARV